jgi:hypothetical protein
MVHGPADNRRSLLMASSHAGEVQPAEVSRVNLREIPFPARTRSFPPLDARIRSGQIQESAIENQRGRAGALVRSLVVAGLAAILAIHQTVVANTDVRHSLAEATEFFAVTRSFGLVALCTVVFSSSGAHETNVARVGGTRKMTLVIAAALLRVHTTATHDFSVAYNSQQ